MPLQLSEEGYRFIVTGIIVSIAGGIGCGVWWFGRLIGVW
jgi:hypothetical protein